MTSCLRVGIILVSGGDVTYVTYVTLTRQVSKKLTSFHDNLSAFAVAQKWPLIALQPITAALYGLIFERKEQAFLSHYGGVFRGLVSGRFPLQIGGRDQLVEAQKSLKLTVGTVATHSIIKQGE